LFDTSFTRGTTFIPINGLIWMADLETMKSHIVEKASQGFHCIKMKIGTHRFTDELSLVRFIRDQYGDAIEIRLDANGAYTFSEALENMDKLAGYHIHSIEQPIRAGQWEKMAELCRLSPVSIALDEELIGVKENHQKTEILEKINPHFIILKPSLIGGFREADQWIQIAKSMNISWWATSALESNIGLGAISQWVSQYPITLAQGLGIGKLYENNFPSTVSAENGLLKYQPVPGWKSSLPL
jgi:o-succinylbenzoate synthase